MSVFWAELAYVGGRVQRDVLIEVDAGRFVEVRPNIPPPVAATLLEGLTIPGLANAHSHAFHRALRGRTQADRGTFWTWRDVMYRAAARLDPILYRRLARATYAEMTLAGITAVGEFHYLHHRPDGEPYDDHNAMGQALLDAAGDAGLRITLLDTLYLHGGLSADGYSPPTGVQVRYDDGSAASWAARIDELRPSSKQRIGAAIHSVRAVDPDAMSVVAAWANRNNAPLHAHVSEQQAENEQCLAYHKRTPSELFHAAGVLNARFSAVHATHLTDHDIALHGAGRGFVCMCPTTERDLGDGVGPTPELAASGVRISLGSDSHAMIDLFEEARAVELDERLRARRRGVHTAGELFDMASVHGHSSLGWDDAGSIAVGHRGDLVTVSLGSVRTAGTSAAAALESVVFSAAAADIVGVIIDGEVIVANGDHARIDVAAELDSAIRELMDS